ncbi:lysophospholipid acyltransferase family protein [Campylobacter geochelonis]|uniref:1-acyl-sn-glycerol-3-phosphate acyltransferase n=1 Tax=Campylobacter geochelonis TaxID=1780362 RepID=A0A128EL79_9BACT|nr:lysophospholipid acyltransferase family protein [Campylobacter geochelonis]QKF72037.1 1-acylglycerol-3-phosphate O-acyltransferase [Campylobacter geochelonis]CZE45772.1 1-acyl-sn-glycerol-3-phosphate acyltransferase [Campylobacter geochelonis]CZE46859.1 1-acyl-sn-glycerol-3-phosphate acyltransferase [Campylobacter geochelonis]CZE49876.1 1-acyl-sn-glycerol-3-phosphate acyltransferase [Campylobacter geochelonis]
MNKIRGVLYFIICVISIFLVVVSMAIFRKANHKCRQIWAKFQKLVIGYKVEQIGEFDPDANIILINHRSMLDIIILEDIYPKNLAWVSKKEIGEIFILGKILTLPKMIAVDRKNPRSIVSLVRDIKDRVDNGRVIAMFPEGTRGRGEKLLKFQDGAKVAIQKLNLKVQPIVLKDTLKLLDAKNISLNSGVVKVACLDVIDTTSPTWYEDLRKDMQEVYDKL